MNQLLPLTNHFFSFGFRQIFAFLLFSVFCSCSGDSNNTLSNTDSLAISESDSSFNHQALGPNLSNNTCAYSNDVSSLGIGIVIAPEEFVLFRDSLLKDKLQEINMYEDIGKITICSKFFKPDYGIMHFVCLGINQNSYRVLINYSDIVYFPKTKGYKFRTWEEYILQSFGIRRLPAKEEGSSLLLPLRNRHDDRADTITIPDGLELFCPMEIKRDWVKVKYDCYYNEDDNMHEGEPCQNYINTCNEPITAWLRWRQNNKLNIDIFLMP